MAHDPLAPARGTCVQAPTTNLSSNDPWRDTESPQAPETSRRVLEGEKPRGAEGDPGKQREKDCWGRWHKKPDTTTKAATDLRTGPARTRKTRSRDVDTQTRETGRTPTRHPDAVFIMHLLPRSVEDRMPLAGRTPDEYASATSPAPLG